MCIMSVIQLSHFLRNKIQTTMMRSCVRCLFSPGLPLILALFGLSCGVSSSEPGHLEVRVRDHREAIGDFRELWLTISAIAIHPIGQPRTEGWIELKPSV